MLGFHWKSNGMWLVAARKVNGSNGSTNHSGIFAKLHMDFKATASIGRAMSEQDLRAMFTEIGCIMEDASLLALLWQANDGLSPADRVAQLRKAHDRIGALLDAIEIYVG